MNEPDNHKDKVESLYQRLPGTTGTDRSLNRTCFFFFFLSFKKPREKQNKKKKKKRNRMSHVEKKSGGSALKHLRGTLKHAGLLGKQ